jgi:hypothetical protein
MRIFPRKKCSSTGKLKLRKDEAKKIVKKSEAQVAYYRCDWCKQYHTTTKKRKLDGLMINLKDNITGLELVSRSSDWKYINRQDQDGTVWYKMTMHDIDYIIAWNDMLGAGTYKPARVS